MKYVVEYFFDDEAGETFRKWLPSSDYDLILETLLDHMKGGRSKVDWYGPPFI